MNAILKRLKSRTYQFACFLMASGLVEANTGAISDAIQTYVPPQWRFLIPMVIAAIVALLREITKTPLSEK